MKGIITTYRAEYYQKKDRFKNKSKEQRAKELDNIICPKCKYQNKKVFIQKYGKCHLCGTTLDNNYFKKIMQKKLKES